MIDVDQISTEKLLVIVYAAVTAAIEKDGYITIEIVGNLASVTVGKIPAEQDPAQLG